MIKIFNLVTTFLVIGITAAWLFTLTPIVSADHCGTGVAHITGGGCPTYISTFGSMGTGSGQFNQPNGIFLNDTNIFVTDGLNDRVQIFTLDGTYAGQFGSSGDGNGQFESPRGIAVNDTNIFVTDGLNQRVQIFTLDGTYAGQFGSTGLGDGKFNRPWGIAVNDTHIFVTDRVNHRVQIFTLLGVYVGQFGSLGSDNGQFNRPSGISVNDTNIFVTDGLNDRVQIFTLDGTYAGQFGSSGDGNGQFNKPRGISVNDTHIFVTDIVNNRVQIFTLLGVYVGRFGSPGSDNGQFNKPRGISVNDTNIFVIDGDNHRVQIFAIPTIQNACPTGQIRNNAGTCVVVSEGGFPYDFTQNGSVGQNDGLVFYLLASGIPVAATGIVIEKEAGSPLKNNPYDALDELEALIKANDSRYDFTQNGSVGQNDGLVFYLLASGITVAATGIVIEKEAGSSIKGNPYDALELLKASFP